MLGTFLRSVVTSLWFLLFKGGEELRGWLASLSAGEAVDPGNPSGGLLGHPKRKPQHECLYTCILRLVNIH